MGRQANKWLTFTTILWVAPQLIGQGIIKLQPQVVWREPDVIFIPRNGADAAAEIQSLSTGTRKVPPVPRQRSTGKDLGKSYSMGVQVASSQIHYLHADILETPGKDRGEPERKLKISIFRFNESKWTWEKEPSSTLIWSKGLTPYLLREDLILGVATSAKSFEKDGKAHLFLTFKRGEDGVFHAHSYPSTGLDKPVFKADGNWQYPALSNLWLSGKVAKSSKYFVLASGAGTCWIFDVEKGSLVSLAQLYQSVTEEKMIAGEVWNGALLGIQPKRDGDFLVSALDEYALTQGFLMDQRAGRPFYGTSQERYAKLQGTLDAIMRMNPRVDWFLLDQDTRRFLPEVPPRGLPEFIHGAAELQRFDWAIKPDGNLAFFGLNTESEGAGSRPIKGSKKPGSINPGGPRPE